jgi:hypothetical protein
VHYYSLSRGLTLVSFSPILLCNLIVSIEDGSLWDALGSLGGYPPVIFDHLEPVWLARIWFGGGDRCHDMIDMIYEMYLELEDN